MWLTEAGYIARYQLLSAARYLGVHRGLQDNSLVLITGELDTGSHELLIGGCIMGA